MKINKNVTQTNEEQAKRLKTLKNRLRLGKETIRELSNSDLKRVVGGALSGDSNCPFTGCDTSDIRLKTNIREIENALETILNLKGFKYEWKRDENTGLPLSEGAPLGFVAQEVEKVLPEVVTTTANGYKAIFYQNITAVLVEAMKQQQEIIDRQKAEMEEIKERQAMIDEQLAEMKALVQKLGVLAQPQAQAAGK